MSRRQFTPEAAKALEKRTRMTPPKPKRAKRSAAERWRALSQMDRELALCSVRCEIENTEEALRDLDRATPAGRVYAAELRALKIAHSVLREMRKT